MKEKLSQRTTRKRTSTSLFVWVWGAFTLVCFLLLLLFSVSQRVLMQRTMTHQAVQDLTVRGQTIQERLTEGTPSEFEGESEYAQHLSATYGVSVYILDGEGTVQNESATSVDFSKKIAQIKRNLSDRESTVYQDGREYVYACELTEDDGGRYLYVAKDMAFLGEWLKAMEGRTLLTALFIFVLSFAVSAAVSGLFTKPIGEMTGKAKQLAKGDFSVDFHGDDYGREMGELADSLNFARDELAKTDLMQKELIANVSHDFKTPLTMIKAYASMIIEISGEDKQKREKHAKVIVDEADRLASLVGDLLDLSKLQSGITALQKEQFDLSAYARQTVEQLEYLQAKGYAFTVEIEEGIFIEADKGKIGQVLHNLIGNAVNYTGEDRLVYVGLHRQGDVGRFYVRDTGEGIPAAELKDIWDRYYRSSSAHKRPVQGTGLGLSIVRKVLEMHGFAYGVESEEGKGSVFYFEFPLRGGEEL